MKADTRLILALDETDEAKALSVADQVEGNRAISQSSGDL
jgi:hypothetical protein